MKRCVAAGPGARIGHVPEYAARKAMKLSKLSLLFSATLLLIVGINGSISILVLNAFNRAQAEQDHRLEALRHVDDLRREMDTLSGLVRSYVVTCESRYLTYYYAILAIREGDQPPVADGEPATFWSRVIAGTTPYDPRSERPRESVWARMRALGFEDAELAALERVRLEAEAIKALEQVAFAATQGLYDPVARSFVAAGKPGLIVPQMVKQGAIVIDVGINRLADGRLVGDVAYQAAAERASFITPVPGGVGPMTVASLIENTLEACELYHS